MSVSGPEEPLFLPPVHRPPVGHHGRQGGNPMCRTKRRTKKRDFKSASAAGLSNGGRSTAGERSITSASSVFPSSTPGDTPSTSRTTSRTSHFGHVLRHTDLGSAICKDVPPQHDLGFDPVYSVNYTDMKQRLLKGKFRGLLHSYFPDLIKAQKMVIPEAREGRDEDYDTDLDIGLGLELLADEQLNKHKEDGVCAEYKSLCRKYKVVPNSYFIRHVMDDYMRMRYRYFNFGDSASLSAELQNQPSVTKVDFEDNMMGPAGMLCFAEMMKSNAYITEANFANNNVGVFGARLMKFILKKSCRLEKLNMAGNKFGPRGAVYIQKALTVNHTLKELSVANNGIDDEGAHLVGKALEKNVGLEVLDISWNHIGRKGAVALAKGLKLNTRLRTLKLRMNGCGEEGGKALISALRYNDSLRHLDLSSNRVGIEVAKAIQKGLPYIRLTNLKLAYNPLTSGAAHGILTSLVALDTPLLVDLDLNGVFVEDDFQLLAQELGSRQVTVHYHVPPCSRERSHSGPLATLGEVISFLDDVEMGPETLFPNLEEGEVVMTVEDLFLHMESSGMFQDKTRLEKLKQDSMQEFKKKFLIRELFEVATLRRQASGDNMAAGNDLDLTSSTFDLMPTERSEISIDTGTTT